MQPVSLDYWADVEPGSFIHQEQGENFFGARRCKSCSKYIPFHGPRARCAACSHRWWDLDGDTPAWGETIDYEQWKEGQMHIDERRLRKRLLEQGFVIEPTNAKGGWRVKSPSGGIHHMHTTSLDDHALNIIKDLERMGFRSDHDAWRREQQKKKELARRKEEEAREKKRQQEDAELVAKVTAKAEKHDEPWLVGDEWHCHLCDFTHTYKPSMFIHAKRVHDWKRSEEAILADRRAAWTRNNAKQRGAKQKPSTPPATPKAQMAATGRPSATPIKRSVLPDEELTDIAKVRKLATRIERGSAMMAEAARALVEKFESQDNELRELKAKQAKLEKKIAGIVDAL